MVRKVNDYFLENIHNYQINKESFTLYIGGEAAVHEDDQEPGVNFLMANRFEKNLETLSFLDAKRPILINMSSCGGWWEEGMQMFSAILACPNPITIIGNKHCRSMSSIIPLAADRFYMRPPAKYMYHRGNTGIDAIEEEFDTEDEERRKTTEVMLNVYATRLKEQGKYNHLSENKIKSLLRSNMKSKINVHLSTTEALEWGFIDGLFMGDYETVRIDQVDNDRRNRMWNALLKDVKMEIKVT